MIKRKHKERWKRNGEANKGMEWLWMEQPEAAGEVELMGSSTKQEMKVKFGQRW